jgi:mxaC protein
MSFDEAWVLFLLPLSALPWRLTRGAALANGWLAFAPRDRASVWAGHGFKTLMTIALAALVVALAGPHRSEYRVERVGRGAEIALVVDRSRSMDQGFAPGSSAPARRTGPEALDFFFSQTPGRLRESKGKVARRLLSEFAAQRVNDRFALIAFSTLPIRILDFTNKAEVIQAAISAGNVGRGLAETNIGAALEAALALFDQRAYTGSRIIVLVSDGGDRLDPDTREQIAHLIRKQRVSIYWLYLRSANSPGLRQSADDSPDAADSVPEMLLHRYFSSLPTPYRAYEASDSLALQHAIEDVDRLEKWPITYTDLVPRRDLTPWATALALVCVLLMLGAKIVEIRRWA